MSSAKKASKPLKRLNHKHLYFVEYYLTHLPYDAKAAYKATYGCADSTADRKGRFLVRNGPVAKEIAKRLRKASGFKDVTIADIQEELRLVGFARQRDYCTISDDGSMKLIPFDQMPPGADAAISGIEEIQKIMSSGEGKGDAIILERRLKFKRWDKVKALELLGKQKRLQMFSDKIDVSLSGTIQVVVKGRKP